MGRIIAAYDLMPESTEVDLEKVIEALKGAVPAGVKVIETKILPVAFGLMKINAGFDIEDSKDSIGGDLETALSSLPGIENIECISSTVL
ncbi:MAG: translation elongation factor EF-1beta [Candidatus Methanoplasma sp.]|jgi:elongation factor 1-beta|nr:translation elongation factor EF-1beta [Candidatus Methanoplasma sp.]